MSAKTRYIEGPAGHRLAVRHTATRSGRSFVWLAGFNSDMAGEKVTALEAWAVKAGHGFTAFDYSGHGQSEGAFEDGTITSWHDDTLAVLDAVTKGPQILVGSSMGGWMAMLAARARPDRVSGLVLVAPAPDFTSRLMWPSLPSEGRFAITQQGRWLQPSAYGDPVPITRALIESGARHNVMGAPYDFAGPVRILQGMLDDAVPWRHAEQLVETITSRDLTFTLIKDGDHRLSRPHDIARLIHTCTEIASA